MSQINSTPPQNNQAFSKPSQADWEKAWPLKREGQELKGACPVCGGDDRFYIKPDGSFNCRQCDSDYKKTLQGAGFWQEPNSNHYQAPSLTKLTWELSGTQGTSFRAVRLEHPRQARRSVIGKNPKGLICNLGKGGIPTMANKELGKLIPY